MPRGAVTFTLFRKFSRVKSSHFNRNQRDQEFCLKARDFPMQISQRWLHWSTERCLVWNWLLWEMCFILSTIDNIFADFKVCWNFCERTSTAETGVLLIGHAPFHPPLAQMNAISLPPSLHIHRPLISAAEGANMALSNTNAHWMEAVLSCVRQAQDQLGWY